MPIAPTESATVWEKTHLLSLYALSLWTAGPVRITPILLVSSAAILLRASCVLVTVSDRTFPIGDNNTPCSKLAEFNRSAVGRVNE